MNAFLKWSKGLENLHLVGPAAQLLALFGVRFISTAVCRHYWSYVIDIHNQFRVLVLRAERIL